MIMKSSEVFGEEVLENSRSHRRQASEKDSRPSCNQLPHSKKTAREEETTMMVMGFFPKLLEYFIQKETGYTWVLVYPPRGLAKNQTHQL